MNDGSGETWIEVYTRCMDGEFYRGRHCPRDGHQNLISDWVTDAVERIRDEGRRVSIAELLRQGFEGNPADLFVVEFNSREHAAHWLRPEG